MPRVCVVRPTNLFCSHIPIDVPTPTCFTNASSVRCTSYKSHRCAYPIDVPYGLLLYKCLECALYVLQISSVRIYPLMSLRPLVSQMRPVCVVRPTNLIGVHTPLMSPTDSCFTNASSVRCTSYKSLLFAYTHCCPYAHLF